MKKPLSPELDAWLQGYNILIAQLEKDGYVDTPESVRNGLARLTANLVTDFPEVARVVDTQVDGPAGENRAVRNRAEGRRSARVPGHCSIPGNLWFRGS